MKKHGLLLLLIGIIIGQSAIISAGQAGSTYPTIYHSRDLIDLASDEIDEYERPNIDLLFVPLGWSRDGKFAYISGKDGGGAGTSEVGYFSWIIQDLVTDKCLWKSDYGLEEGIPWESEEKGEIEKILNWVYANYKGRYQKYFDKFEIVIDNDIKLCKFPLYYNGNEYRGQITDVVRRTKYQVPNTVTDYSVVVTRNGAKKIVSRNSDQFLVNAQIAGYFQSPYEPRIAVVVGRLERGWEGPPNPIYCSIVGCHLEKGF